MKIGLDPVFEISIPYGVASTVPACRLTLEFPLTWRSTGRPGAPRPKLSTVPTSTSRSCCPGSSTSPVVIASPASERDPAISQPVGEMVPEFGQRDAGQTGGQQQAECHRTEERDHDH